MLKSLNEEGSAQSPFFGQWHCSRYFSSTPGLAPLIYHLLQEASRVVSPGRSSVRSQKTTLMYLASLYFLEDVKAINYWFPSL